MFRSNRGMCKSRIFGILLMLAGLIIMMIIVPYWAWTGIICTVITVIGFLLWKFC
ncbi:MAG: hypothetical protein IJC56_02245 [Clostridia bacterium]|nr:hypothetical protein [Clostridia bacterium]